MIKIEHTEALYKALNNLLTVPDLYPCEHIYTHRGGVIWTICDDCGEHFADDRGGIPEYKLHKYVEAALDTINLIKKEVKCKQL